MTKKNSVVSYFAFNQTTKSTAYLTLRIRHMKKTLFISLLLLLGLVPFLHAENTPPLSESQATSSIFDQLVQEGLLSTDDLQRAYKWADNNESGLDPSIISKENNWLNYLGEGANATGKMADRWANLNLDHESLIMVFDSAQLDGKNIYNTLKQDFTPLTLGGLIVTSLAEKTKTSSGDLTPYILRHNSKTSNLHHLNIDSGNSDKSVIFNLLESFNLGTKDYQYTAINVNSDWDINIASGKTLSLFGALTGGKGKTITFNNGGTVSLNNDSSSLQADIVLKNATTLQFGMSGTYNTKFLLGTGTITVYQGGLQIYGRSGTEINNNIHIVKGNDPNNPGYFYVHEQVRTGFTYEERRDLTIDILVSGNISGDGIWYRHSESGYYASCESWIFTGDNSKFSGDWYFHADANQFITHMDKKYDYVPSVFGDGSKYTGNADFSSIAGTGDIIGLNKYVDKYGKEVHSENSRAGSLVGFNYANDVTIINNLRDNLKIRHLTNATLTLSGTNTHYWGTYAEHGGTIRFSDSKNLGCVNGSIEAGFQKEGGAPIVLNNDSTLEYDAMLRGDYNEKDHHTVTLNNALFNDSGKWGIKVTQANSTLQWDLTTLGVYKYVYDHIASYRKGEFTKSGAGTLHITKGDLLTEAGKINIKEGTLSFSSDATYGTAKNNAAYTITMWGATLRKTGGLSLDSNLTLASFSKSGSHTQNTIDFDFILNGGTIDFTINNVDGITNDNQSESTSNIFDNVVNDFIINGELSITANTTLNFNFLDGSYFKKDGYYLLLTANNDLSLLSQEDLDNFFKSNLPINDSESRQTFKFVVGNASWGGKNNQLYLSVNPENTTLTWNHANGSGDWAHKQGRNDWTGHKIDSSFYNGDRVIFKDYAVEGEKTITLKSDVSPVNILVDSSSNYIFKSEQNTDGKNLYSIIGAGSLTKQGKGTLTINNTNAYTSGTFVKDGTLIANADTALGTGAITIDGNDAILISNANNALGKSDINLKNGRVELRASNSNKVLINILGGIMSAEASNAISGTVNISGGELYLKGDNSITQADVNITNSGKVIAIGKDSFGNSTTAQSKVTISQGGVLNTTNMPVSSLGTANIFLQTGGTLFLQNSEAMRSLSSLNFDGGLLKIAGDVDLSYFDKISISSKNIANIEVVGPQSKLTLGENLSKGQFFSIQKSGHGTLDISLGSDFIQSLNFQEIDSNGTGMVIFRQTAQNCIYNNHTMYGSIGGSGIVEMQGGNINFHSNLTDFEGRLRINLDQISGKNDCYSLFLQNNELNTNRLFDVEFKQGNAYIDGTSSQITMYIGNLFSGSGEIAQYSKIGVQDTVDPSTLSKNYAISVTQTIDATFKGLFVNGGTNGKAEIDLIKNGNAILTLDNDNTSTGTLTINQGVIQLGSGADKGSWAGNIKNNATLSFNYGNINKTIVSDISGTGQVNINTDNIGSVTFTGNNTYSGGTHIQNGTVNIAQGSSLGSGNIQMSGHSTLNANNSKSMNGKTISVNKNTVATINNTQLGSTGKITSDMISISKGSIVKVTLNTVNRSLTGHVEGAQITSKGDMTIKDIHLGQSSSILSDTASTNISGSLELTYTADNLLDNGIINGSNLSVSGNGTFNLTTLSTVMINLTDDLLQASNQMETLTINIFDLEQSKSFTFGDEIKIVLDENTIKEGWKIADSNFEENSSWKTTGDIVLVKSNPVPEPSGALLSLLGLSACILKRKRKA